jgi:hypothetical protein
MVFKTDKNSNPNLGLPNPSLGLVGREGVGYGFWVGFAWVCLGLLGFGFGFGKNGLKRLGLLGFFSRRGKNV